MRSSLEPKEDILSTTSESKKLEIKENLFNHLDKLAADHDVTVTNTMIKITYKKAFKDQNASDGNVEPSTDSDSKGKKKKPNETATTIFPKGPLFHSTPIDTEKKKKKKKRQKNYINGLNLNITDGKKNCASFKVQNPHKEGGSSLKKCKNVPNSGQRFLKGDGILKPKASIRKSGGEAKKTKLSDKKIKKLENGVKKKTGSDKKQVKIGGLKRKPSNTELNVKCKKVKIIETKEQNGSAVGEVEEGNKSGGKKQIMLVDPDLPVGWSRHIRTKNKGSANEQYVVYVVNPQGKKFRFKWKLRKYLQKTNSTLDADQFFFGLYQRPKALSAEKFENERIEPEDSEGQENGHGKPDESLSDVARDTNGRELLRSDPNLPFGWKRIIHSNAANGRKQVHIISPDGKIFRRRHRLNEYLIKHQSNYDLDKFYFGLYRKKEGNSSGILEKETEGKTLSDVKLYNKAENSKTGSAMIVKKTKTNANSANEVQLNSFKDSVPSAAMFDDPKLPEGWKRFIKIRNCGESAGRMEVVIVSPDGRRHRTKKHLEHYLLKKQLKYKAKDFDFTICGKSKSKKRPPRTDSPETETPHLGFPPMKKKFTDKPVPELDLNCLKNDVITREGHMINTANGMMMCCGLSTARSERRQRLPRREHEKQLKSYLNENEEEVTSREGGSDVPARWVKRLVKCRAELRSLDDDAVTAVAETTKKFIKMLAVEAFACSQEQEIGLRYEDLADFVDRTESLSFLKILIPKKITFREYIKLNRPKQFMSFT